ncbi:MAG TPA: hypothetical protein VHA54_03410 [Solirubrobacterales bacterium]|nr:hypothetical protein [Solirubrobacterales bacterium]
MNWARKRLTYANVMSSLAVFLVLGGGAAFAASHLGKNSVGTKQLKKNSVTTAKINKGAVTGAKLAAGAVGAGALAAGSVDGSKLGAGAVSGDKLASGAVSADKLANGAVTSGKIAAGAVSGANINAGSTPFSQVVARLRGTGTLPFTAGQVYPFSNPTYVQPAGEDDQFLGSLNVTFPASCLPPRQATAYLLLNAPNPSVPTAADIIGFGTASDTQGGTLSKPVTFASLPGFGAQYSLGTSAPQSQTFAVYLISSACSSGSGVTATGAALDIIGTK